MITLKSLHLATLQAIFDQVVAHLRKQNSKALNDQMLCSYRTPDGKKCAAGCLIADDEYNPLMESFVVHGDQFWEATPIPRPSGKELLLVRELQQCHDSYSVHHWDSRFAAIAQNFDLEYKPREGA